MNEILLGVKCHAMNFNDELWIWVSALAFGILYLQDSWKLCYSILLKFIKSIQYYWEYIGAECYKWYGICSQGNYISPLFPCLYDRCAYHQSHIPPFQFFPWDLLLYKKEKALWDLIKLPSAIIGHWRAYQGKLCLYLIMGERDRQIDRVSFLSSFSPFIFPN